MVRLRLTHGSCIVLQEESVLYRSDGAAEDQGARRASRQTTPSLKHAEEDRLSRFFGRRKESVAMQLTATKNATVEEKQKFALQWLPSRRKQSANSTLSPMDPPQNSTLALRRKSSPQLMSSGDKFDATQSSQATSTPANSKSEPRRDVEEERLAKFFGRRKESVITVLKREPVKKESEEAGNWRKPKTIRLGSRNGTSPPSVGARQ